MCAGILVVNIAEDEDVVTDHDSCDKVPKRLSVGSIHDSSPSPFQALSIFKYLIKQDFNYSGVNLTSTYRI